MPPLLTVLIGHLRFDICSWLAKFQHDFFWFLNHTKLKNTSMVSFALANQVCKTGVENDPMFYARYCFIFLSAQTMGNNHSPKQLSKI